VSVPTAGSEATGTAEDGARSPWLIFAIVSIALFMSSLDGTIVATGLPTLRHALHTQINWASWTMTGYQLGLVVAMPVAGRVADNFGRKRVFLAAAILFTTSSLLCGLAANIGMLIALRFLQAAGARLSYPPPAASSWRCSASTVTGPSACSRAFSPWGHWSARSSAGSS